LLKDVIQFTPDRDFVTLESMLREANGSCECARDDMLRDGLFAEAQQVKTEAIHCRAWRYGLLRFARNDD
jgi:hypothetical protein